MAQKTVTTKPTRNKWIKKMAPVAIIGAAVLAGLGIYGARLSGGGKNLTSDINLGTSNLYKNLSKGRTAATTVQAVAGPHDYLSSAPTGVSVTTAASSGGGISGFFSNLLGGMFGGEGGTGISLGNIISGIGGYFGSKATYELSERALDIQEKLGGQRLALETMKAEAAIEAEKRQTAIGSTFMGHTNPIAAAAGVPGVEQGLQVAEWGGPQQGLIAQAKQGQAS